jgi:hypothetical protein
LTQKGILIKSDNEIGNWIASTPIPAESLETRETRLQGEQKQLFLAFVRKLLCWLPENRQSADELLTDAFLNVEGLKSTKAQ